MGETTTVPLCPNCGGVLIGIHHQCPPSWFQVAPPVFVQTGWICPVCGSGVAPTLTVCPCKSVHTLFRNAW